MTLPIISQLMERLQANILNYDIPVGRIDGKRPTTFDVQWLQPVRLTPIRLTMRFRRPRQSRSAPRMTTLWRYRLKMTANSILLANNIVGAFRVSRYVTTRPVTNATDFSH